MIKKFTGYRLQAFGSEAQARRVTVLILCLVLIALFLLPPNAYRLMPTFAQSPACPAQSSNPRVTNGLISASSITDTKFSNNTGTCVVDPNKAPFVPYKIPTYDDLKSLYYTQAKSSTSSEKHPPLEGDRTDGDIKLTSNPDHLYYVTGNLNINSNIPGNQTGVVFVDGNLTINPSGKKLTTGTSVGLVFVVKGNIIIDQSVTQIDAILISSGTIYTAGAGCSHSSPVTASQLVINGSLISLDGNKNIEFCRSLANNSTAPAEKINYQPKYLVILRNLFSDTLQKWSEIQ